MPDQVTPELPNQVRPELPDQVQREADLAQAFAEIARKLQAPETREDTWDRVVQLAGELLPEFEYAAISLVRRDRSVNTVAASSEVAGVVDAIQYETGEGPCLSAIWDSDMYVTGDLATENRWPAFSKRTVEETGIRSMLSFKLFVLEDGLGALNLYNRGVDAFDERAQAFGGVLAAHAAIAMSAADEHEHAEQLEHAVASNREIGMAVGIVMVQSRIDRRRAFGILSQASQRMNVPVRDVAARIVEGEEQHNTGGGPASPV